MGENGGNWEKMAEMGRKVEKIGRKWGKLGENGGKWEKMGFHGGARGAAHALQPAHAAETGW